MDGGFVAIRLHCLHAGQACRGVLLLIPSQRHAVRLARVHFRVPAGRTRRIAVRLTREGSTYLEAHERLRALLRARYAGGTVDAFRLIVVG